MMPFLRSKHFLCYQTEEISQPCANRAPQFRSSAESRIFTERNCESRRELKRRQNTSTHAEETTQPSPGSPSAANHSFSPPKSATARRKPRKCAGVNKTLGRNESINTPECESVWIHRHGREKPAGIWSTSWDSDAAEWFWFWFFDSASFTNDSALWHTERRLRPTLIQLQPKKKNKCRHSSKIKALSRLWALGMLTHESNELIQKVKRSKINH